MSYISLSDFQLFPLRLKLFPLLLLEQVKTLSRLLLLTTESTEKFNSDEKRKFNGAINLVLPGVSADSLDFQPSTQLRGKCRGITCHLLNNADVIPHYARSISLALSHSISIPLMIHQRYRDL